MFFFMIHVNISLISRVFFLNLISSKTLELSISFEGYPIFVRIIYLFIFSSYGLPYKYVIAGFFLIYIFVSQHMWQF